MRSIFAVVIFLLAGTTFTYGQALSNIECQSYKNGTFVTEGGLFNGRYAIKRRGNKQVEVDQNGSKFVFDVRWVDECSYVLKLRKISKNPMEIQWQEGDSIIVNIEQVNANGYRIRSTTTDGLSATTKILSLNRKDSKRFLRDNGFDPSLMTEEEMEEDDAGE